MYFFSRRVFCIGLMLVFFVGCKETKKPSQNIQTTTEEVKTPVQKSGTVSDVDGNVYRFLEMCDGKEWMIENLNVSKYRNGDEIPQVQDPVEWANLKTGAWCYYLKDSSYGAVFGKLYNWYAINDPRGIAPEGWRVATKEDWKQISDCLGGENVAGGKLKEIGSSHWMSPNVGAVNTSGFSALPGGGRSSKGDFTMVDNLGIYWTKTNYDELQAWIRHLSYSNTYVVEFYNDKRNGFSVRCVKE
ncbi:MAG: fibrobacter succinogenes major paralogous domain-containing protein [Flavobacteriaceae bacterium]